MADSYWLLAFLKKLKMCSEPRNTRSLIGLSILKANGYQLIANGYQSS